MSTVSNGRRRAFRSRHRAPMSEGGKLAIIFVSLALILFVLAVMLGNYLRSLAEEIVDDTTETAAETVQPPIPVFAPAKMIGRGVIFGVDYSVQPDSSETVASTETETGNETATETESVKFDAVSVTLRDKDSESGKMRLAYNSEVSLRYSFDECGDEPLDSGVALIKSNWGKDIRVCAIFAVSYVNEPETTSEIVRAYEAALISELIDAGFDEILLTGLSGDIDEGVEFIDQIYEKKGRGTPIGLTLEFDFLNSDTVSNELAELVKKCGFLVLDLHSLTVPEMQSVESLIYDRVSRTADVCREHSLRVMLGCGVTPDCESQTASAISAGADNVMTALGLPEKSAPDTSDTKKSE